MSQANRPTPPPIGKKSNPTGTQVMDFFEHQQQARSRSFILVTGFILTIVMMVAAIYTAMVLILGAGNQDGSLPWLAPDLLLWVAIFVTALIGGGSLIKITELRAGGRAVAEMLGCKLVTPNSRDPDERKLLNVVEEMAIASGTPVPPVYLMDDEPGINAFAAGYSQQDAVIGVTRGCMVSLTRDELQGVVAHEFSHILNGDMRLNIRMIGLLHGIVMIAVFGMTMVRMGMISSASRRGMARRNSKDGDPGAALIAIGAVLLIVGSIGQLVGAILKSAVSRQREYLADASAVQFTRNPSGIGGALRKIGGISAGSNIQRAAGSEISHMFFGQAFCRGLDGLFATHPPLLKRIRRIEPGFDGSFPKVQPVRLAPKVDQGRDGRSGIPIAAMAAVSTKQLDAAVKMIGQPTEAHVGYARQLIGSLPEAVLDAVHSPDDARGVIHALLLDDDESVRRTQLDRLTSHSDAHTRRLAERIFPEVQKIPDEARLMTVDLAIPALSEMIVDQYRRFLANVDHLIAADKKVTLFEWALRRVVVHNLERRFNLRPPARASIYNFSGVRDAISKVLSTLARVGSTKSDEILKAFQAGALLIQTAGLELKPASECGLAQLDQAMDQLEKLPPKLKKRLIGAFAACIGADMKVNLREGELLRAICDTLDCPMPPLLPGQSL